MLSAKFALDLKPLEGLKKSLTNKIVRQAMREASKPMLKEVKKNAATHKRTGFLQKVFKIKMRTYKTGIVAIVGPATTKFTLGTRVRGKRKGQPRVYRPSSIVHLFEKGTKRMVASPIMKTALASKQTAYFSELTAILKRKIQEELTK